MKASRVVFLLPFLALGLIRFGLRGGFQWGPAKIEVIQAYRPQFQPLHRGLQRLAERLDAEGPIEQLQVADDLSPRPVMRFDEPTESNTSLIALTDLQSYQIRNLSGSAEISHEDLEGQRFSSSEFDGFEHALAWTGDANPLARAVWEDDGSDMEHTLKHALAVEYLFVGRSREVAASADDESQRRLACDVFLVQLSTEKVVARIPLAFSAGGLDDGRWSPDRRQVEIVAGLQQALGEKADIQWPANE